jgi:DNA polymerase-1
MQPATPAAYQLLHQGVIALSQVEQNGVRIDRERLRGNIKKVGKIVQRYTDEIEQDEVFRAWRKRYGKQSNLDSGEQLGKVLFEDLEYPAKEYTATGRPKTTEEALQRINHPFVKLYLKRKKYVKLGSTYLRGVWRELEDNDLIHVFFNLHKVTTYRSSSDGPNLQNMPIRDKEQARWIRSVFIPRPGHRLISHDFSGIEVRVAACYHKDPTMLRYIREGYDMHYDMGIECYLLPARERWQSPEQRGWLKEIRQQAKALFVFAQFYGDYYISCAKSLWDAIYTHKLKGPDGKSLYKWLARKGITGLGACNPKLPPVPGTFEYHLKEVERRFWKERFPVYDQWRRDWYDAYQRKGYFHTYTGFLVQGVEARNKVINNPVQGSAFHCLLWCLIRTNRWLLKNRMRSMIVGQIHDDLMSDVHEAERNDYLAKVEEVMTVDLPREFGWIITPIDVEAKESEVDGNWHEQTEIKKAA